MCRCFLPFIITVVLSLPACLGSDKPDTEVFSGRIESPNTIEFAQVLSDDDIVYLTCRVFYDLRPKSSGFDSPRDETEYISFVAENSFLLSNSDSLFLKTGSYKRSFGGKKYVQVPNTPAGSPSDLKVSEILYLGKDSINRELIDSIAEKSHYFKDYRKIFTNPEVGIDKRTYQLAGISLRFSYLTRGQATKMEGKRNGDSLVLY